MRTEDPTAPAADAPPSDDGREPVTDDQTPGAAFEDAQRRFEELKEFVSYYISAKLDAAKLSITRLVIYAVLGVVGLLAGSALVVMAVALACIGLAGALAVLFGHRPWLGNLVTGVVLLAGVGGGAWFGLQWMTKASRERTLKKYAARQQQQRARFGADVEQAATGPTE